MGKRSCGADNYRSREGIQSTWSLRANLIYILSTYNLAINFDACPPSSWLPRFPAFLSTKEARTAFHIKNVYACVWNHVKRHLWRGWTRKFSEAGEEKTAEEKSVCHSSEAIDCWEATRSGRVRDDTTNKWNNKNKIKILHRQ